MRFFSEVETYLEADEDEKVQHGVLKVFDFEHLLRQRDGNGQTVLHLAAMVGKRHPMLLELLLNPDKSWGSWLSTIRDDEAVLDSRAPYRGPDCFAFEATWKLVRRTNSHEPMSGRTVPATRIARMDQRKNSQASSRLT